MDKEVPSQEQNQVLIKELPSLPGLRNQCSTGFHHGHRPVTTVNIAIFCFLNRVFISYPVPIPPCMLATVGETENLQLIQPSNK